MSDEKLTAKDAAFKLICLAPDVCKTPVGSAMVPIPYPITHTMDQGEQCSANVYVNGRKAFLHKKSYVDNVQGDAPGTGKGIVSGVHMKVSHSKDHSKSVYINNHAIVRTGDQVEMNTAKP